MGRTGGPRPPSRTKVVAHLYLPGEYTAGAEALLSREPEWVAPALWRSEFRNILAGCLRRGTLTFEQACDIQHEAESLLADGEYEVDSDAVLALVRDSNCSAYDCEFVALAISLDTTLVTMDGKVLEAFAGRAVSLGD